MEYTKNGLRITLEELEKMLNEAKTAQKHNSMENCIYIKGGKKPEITQYCSYRECNPKNHTYGVVNMLEE
ncbi:MAG: hypothetical protein IKN04_20495 [Clostridia bacterium]|nr:hypothetical protein [Clostridia bacterium]